MSSLSLRKMSCQINLLDSKRSLNVSIFLRQFHNSLSAGDIVNHLLMTRTDGRVVGGGNGRCPDAETLACLLKIAPEDDEVQRLRAFSGDRRRLGIAERFLTELASLPKYAANSYVVFTRLPSTLMPHDNYEN